MNPVTTLPMKSNGDAGATAAAAAGASATLKAAVCTSGASVSAVAADGTELSAAAASEGVARVLSAAGAGPAAATDGVTLVGVFAAGAVASLLRSGTTAGGWGGWPCGGGGGVPSGGSLTTGVVTGGVALGGGVAVPAGGVEVVSDDNCGAVADSPLDGVALLSAPPELRTTTDGPLVFVVVVSDGDLATAVVPMSCVPVVPVAFVVPAPALADVDSVEEGGLEIDEESDELADAPVAADCALFVPAVLAPSWLPGDEFVDDWPSADGVAPASAGELATAIPTPNATANAPTRPM